MVSHSVPEINGSIDDKSLEHGTLSPVLQSIAIKSRLITTSLNTRFAIDLPSISISTINQNHL